MTTHKKSKTSEKRQNKGHHIDVRFTEEEYNQIVANAAKCGMPKSLYVHNIVLPLYLAACSQAHNHHKYQCCRQNPFHADTPFREYGATEASHCL